MDEAAAGQNFTHTSVENQNNKMWDSNTCTAVYTAMYVHAAPGARKSKSRPANVRVLVTDDEWDSADTGGGDVSGTGVDRLGELAAAAGEAQSDEEDERDSEQPEPLDVERAEDEMSRLAAVADAGDISRMEISILEIDVEREEDESSMLVADAGDVSRTGEMMADSCMDEETLLVKPIDNDVDVSAEASEFETTEQAPLVSLLSPR